MTEACFSGITRAPPRISFRKVRGTESRSTPLASRRKLPSRNNNLPYLNHKFLYAHGSFRCTQKYQGAQMVSEGRCC
jgi:hypothetical protein